MPSILSRTEREAWYARLLDLSLEPIFAWKLDGPIVFWNRGAEKLYGYDREHALGRIPHELLRTVHPAPQSDIEQALLRDGSWVGELTHSARDGRRIVVESVQELVREPEGTPLVLETNRDITARQRAAERERIVSESLGYLLRQDDPEQIVRELFPRVAAHLGVDAYFNFLVDEAAGALYLHSCAGIPPETAEEIRQLQFGEAICGTVAPTRQPILATDIQNTIYAKADLARGFGLQCYFCNPLIARGRLLGTLSFASRNRPEFAPEELEFIRTISDYVAIAFDRLLTARALREGEARYRVLSESMPQLVWSCRPDGKCDYLNRQYCDYTGRALEDLVDDRWLECLHPDDVARTVEHWNAALAQQEAYDVEFRIRRHDGVYRWFKTRAETLRDADGSILRWLGTCTDIQDHRMVVAQLERANQDLQRFAWAASHDLQEPLRMVHTFTELLEKRYSGMLDDSGREALGYVIEGAGRAESLLAGLRNYWQSAERVYREPVALDRALDDALANLRGQLQETGAQLSRGPLPTVVGGHVPMVQLFQNLIGNALKYRHPERLTEIQIWAERSGPEWVMSVADNGIGIAPEYLEEIFGVFKRLHGRGSYPGSGIGLALCRNIVERHGGRIWVESKGGAGARFCFSLPAAEAL